MSDRLLNPGRMNLVGDGISVYSKSLSDHLIDANAKVSFYKPSLLFNKRLAYSFPFNFLASSLIPNYKLNVECDVFHVTDYRSVSMSCPVITTLHDAIPFINPGYANAKLRKFKNFILKQSVKYVDHVIAVSNYSVNEITSCYNVSSDKISVVYNGIDENWLNSRPTQGQVRTVLDKYGLYSEFFLTVGTLQPRKNFERLLNAHSQLPLNIRKSYPLVLVGRLGWSYESLLLTLANKIAAGEAVWLSNVESREDLKCLYSAANSFLFPSLYEGFGLPILEAFATGVPVLTSNTTSLPEISDGIAIEVDPMSLDQMTDGMMHLLNLPDRAERVAAGIARAQNLSWSNCARETIKVYRKVLDGR